MRWYAGTPCPHILVLVLTSLYTTACCPTFSPHLGKSPRACPATRAWNTHPWKATKVGGGTQQSGWWGAKRWRVASVSVWGLERENEGKIQRGMHVWLFCRERTGCWLEGLGGERWNWRRIKWTLGFRRKRGERRWCFERRSGGVLLALRLGLRHASRLCKPLGSGTPEGSQPNLC